MEGGEVTRGDVTGEGGFRDESTLFCLKNVVGLVSPFTLGVLGELNSFSLDCCASIFEVRNNLMERGDRGGL